MTNATMFVYVYGILLKHGTANAWDKVSELSKQSPEAKQWFESQYTISARTLDGLAKILDNNGL